MKTQNFIIVSNRLPVSVSKKDGELVYTPSSGGLATAMASLSTESGEQLWIGWPGIANEDITAADKQQITKKLREFGCHPVFLSRDQVGKFYNGYANDTIWPLFHYFQSYAQYDKDYWEAYKDVNRAFARAVSRHALPDAQIWVHDYHLMLLPQQIRELIPDSTIGFFLHIPFPSYEIFRMLPNRREVLEGLLGADLIGFHVYDYARHFMSSVLRILGVEQSHGSIIMKDRVIKVDAFPIGIDYQKFIAALKEPATKAEIKRIEKHYKDQKIILSVDRLDYSKGIMKRLEAFEMLLQKHPELRGAVSLVIVAVPSRIEVETYKNLRDELEQAIARINGEYGLVDWMPVSYQFKNLPFEQVLALFASSDIALVTPLRDGMNLVAKEYVAAKQKESGVLVLSEMTGAVDELPESLRINPNDIDSIVEAIETALDMPEDEQRQRLEQMQRRLSQYTVQRWAADFTEQLDLSKETQQKQGTKLLTPKIKSGIVSSFKRAKERLLLLDYDGTLRGFVSSHGAQQGAPSESLKALLTSLAALPNTHVCIISGRPRKALDGWFKDIPVSLAAEHGAWMKHDGEWSQQQASMGEHKQKILPILESYAERTPGAKIEQKDFALVWHYRNVATELASARNASLRYELSTALGNTEIGVYNGNKIIEIKPRSIHKGTVAEDLIAVFPSDFILCIGDDYTDEDMFRSIPEEAFSIKVGLGDTIARYQLGGVEDVLRLLEHFINHKQ